MAVGLDTGALLVALSAVAFSTQAALIKLVDVPPILLLQCRGIVLWALAFGSALSGGKLLGVSAEVPRRDLLFGDPSERWLLLLRAVVYTAMILLNWTALECVPAGDATAIAQPFIAANIFAACVLREPLRRIVWPCAALHVGGILLIARPHSVFGAIAERSPSDELVRTEGVMAAIGSAILAGLVAVLTKLCRRSHWIAINHVNDSFCTFFPGPRSSSPSFTPSPATRTSASVATWIACCTR